MVGSVIAVPHFNQRRSVSCEEQRREIRSPCNNSPLAIQTKKPLHPKDEAASRYHLDYTPPVLSAYHLRRDNGR
jgi:hypothetical protein